MTQAASAAIERIDVFGYELTYAHGDYVMSSGRVVNRLPSTVVRITTRDGVRGLRRGLPARHDVPAGVRRGRSGRHPRARPGAHRRRPDQPGRRPPASRRRAPRSRLRQERARRRLLGCVRPDRRPARRGVAWRGAAARAAALRGHPARSTRRHGGLRDPRARARDPQLPGEARRRSRGRRPAGRGDPGRHGTGRRGHRRRERRLAAAGRDHRRAVARGLRAVPARAAVPDARGVPCGPAIDHAADGPRRGHRRPADPRPCRAASTRWTRSTSRSAGSAVCSRRGSCATRRSASGCG